MFRTNSPWGWFMFRFMALFLGYVMTSNECTDLQWRRKGKEYFRLMCCVVKHCSLSVNLVKVAAWFLYFSTERLLLKLPASACARIPDQSFGFQSSFLPNWMFLQRIHKKTGYSFQKCTIGLDLFIPLTNASGQVKSSVKFWHSNVRFFSWPTHCKLDGNIRMLIHCVLTNHLHCTITIEMRPFCIFCIWTCRTSWCANFQENTWSAPWWSVASSSTIRTAHATSQCW